VVSCMRSGHVAVTVDHADIALEIIVPIGEMDVVYAVGGN
jgi:hypothetical protein